MSVGYEGVVSRMSGGSGDGAGEFSNGFHGVDGRGSPVKGWTGRGGVKDCKSTYASTLLRVLGG